MKKILVPVLLVLLCVNVLATEYHVSPSGKDSNRGTKRKPFKTIQKGVDVLQPGDALIIDPGIYFESVKIKISGTEKEKISILADPGTVVLEGREFINSDWEKYQGNIYKAKFEGPVEQVFFTDIMMVEARWPNMSFPDELWERSTWSSADEGSTKGKMIDESLKETKVDWTGALATLNVSHQWWTWTSEVTEHTPGSASFNYSTEDMSGMYGPTDYYKYNDDFYYLSGKLEALDVEGEWYYDEKTSEIYVYIPGGKRPQKGMISVKRRDYGIRVENADYLTISGIDCFACTIGLDNSNYCTVERSKLSYPAYSRKIMERYIGGRMSPSTYIQGNNNIFRQCELSNSSGSGLTVKGSFNLIENNIVHDVCWSGSLDYNAVKISKAANGETAENTVRLNTLFNAGNTILHLTGPGNIAELNHVYAGGKLCQDVSLIYTLLPSCENTQIRFNWVHDVYTPHIALGIRGDDKTRRLSVHHNVVWNIGWDGIVVKGDENKVYNNTGFNGEWSDILIQTGPETVKDWHSHYPSLPERNEHSLTCNNLVEILSGSRWDDTPPAGEVKNNVIHKDFSQLLIFPAIFDFRPKDGIGLVDKGVPVEAGDPFIGKMPDIGAYEYGNSNYWIPGHQEEQASFPIPSDKLVVARTIKDLIWRPAYQAESYDVYLGSTFEEVQQAGENSDYYKGNQTNNIYSAGELKHGVKYYWRVDSKFNEETIKGRVWTFQIVQVL